MKPKKTYKVDVALDRVNIDFLMKLSKRLDCSVDDILNNLVFNDAIREEIRKMHKNGEEDL